MGKRSAGILLFREAGGDLEVFLVHPGGPFYQKQDEGVWSIPKGEFEEGEDPLDAAKREFEEETGQRVEGEFVALKPIKQKGGKEVIAFALKGECRTDIRSNTFSLEWPPRSGKTREFPEVDRAAWFGLEEALSRIRDGQRALLVELRGTALR